MAFILYPFWPQVFNLSISIHSPSLAPPFNNTMLPDYLRLILSTHDRAE